MKKCVLGAAMMMGGSAFAAPAEGAFIYKDSSDFAKQYNAADGLLPETDPGDAFTAGTLQGDPSNTGGVLSYLTGAGEHNWYDADGWAANPSVGWTMEVEVHMYTIQVGVTGFQLFAGAGTTASAAILDVLASGVAWGGTTFVTDDNQDGFHVFRVAQEGGSNVTTIWRDGEFVGSATGTHALNSAWFGDGSGNSGGAHVKYVRWDTTGAYTPIPEPAAMSLLLLAVGGMGARRRG